MQLPRPQAGIGNQVFGAETEDLLNLRTGIQPLPIRARFSGIDRGRKPVDQSSE
jgi:hypothetical protein